MKRIKTFILYWKEGLLISFVCIALFIIAAPDYDNPFYPNQLRNGARVMSERWPCPEPNNPDFLADFRKYMGFDYHFSEPNNNPSKKDFIFWPWRRRR